MCYPRVVNLSSRRCTKCAFDLKPGGEQHLGNLNGLGTFDATKPAHTAASSCAAASRSARFPLARKKLFLPPSTPATSMAKSQCSTARTECEPQGFFAGPRGSRRSLYDPSQNPLPSAATDDRAGRGRDVPGSRVAGRQGIAATRRARRSARASQPFGRTARLAARAWQHGGRQPGECEQELPELASPGG